MPPTRLVLYSQIIATSEKPKEKSAEMRPIVKFIMMLRDAIATQNVESHATRAGAGWGGGSRARGTRGEVRTGPASASW